jgi:hypothetical protein
MEEKVKILKEQIYARLRGEAPKVQVQLGGRSSGNMYALLLALDSCLMELYEQNQALLSNQKSILETNGVLLRRLLELSGVTDVEEIIDGKNNS